ncbi:FAD-dependent oxidoreductase [Kibdelosporangium persicum]|uniref:Cation diffusion facilitator CzcD-associated flavoprotein CzcO n=1 Tax=Kibdelosporangium persicum TaxID=2698649 RepID=A0ABX2F474_9PSEU|nr:FAD-dependent oxidoreductase [Kibdelosporangium persicum]NRN65776.1 Cation diffusion facilitator CzcD-associated flavoprotein CzcO [Kibdelosporangium persicum]
MGDLPVVVIGAGPVGLAAAAHLAERGLPFMVVEAGDGPGASVREWAHIRLFSPWQYNTDPAARRLLEPTGWVLPDAEVLPTGAGLVSEYLAPLAAHPAIAPHVRYGARVAAISREGVDRVRTAGRAEAPFVVRLADGQELSARAVIDASGTWRQPNVLGANGLPARGEEQMGEVIATALPDVLGADRDRYVGVHTLVVGAGHSAANTLLALAELAETAPATRITWAVRGASADRAFGGGDADALPGRGALGSGLRMLIESGRIELRTGFGVRAVRPTADGRVAVDADGQSVTVDRVVAATGFRPDHSIADELRLDLDPAVGCTRALAPLIDPNLHSCGTVRPHGVDELSHPEPNYFIVGMKSYGRAPTFLLATGYEQVRSISAALAGDWSAARDVQLELPETGVCSVTAGARAIAADAAVRLGLPADVPARLVSATIAHYAVTSDLHAAVRAAADELEIEATAADQLAVLVADQLEAMLDTGTADPTVDAAGDGEVVGAAGGSCGAPAGAENLSLSASLAR